MESPENGRMAQKPEVAAAGCGCSVKIITCFGMDGEMDGRRQTADGEMDGG
jgi:hypothetical protein